jgi:deoxycytidylate deaminase
MVAIKNEKPELIIGLVGPAGARLHDVSKVITEHLKTFGYSSETIRISRLLEECHEYDKERTKDGEEKRILYCQEIALNFRRSIKSGAAPALTAIADIRKKRAEATGYPDKPRSAHAYILNQLKHPEEAELLRQVYGSSFILIAGHAPRTAREDNLAKALADDDGKSVDGSYKAKAANIIDIDDSQAVDPDYGQNTRDTYPLADYFVDLTNQGGENGIRRFINLIFGHPFETPHKKEFAMHQAWSASLRSSDFNRQVGAVIVRHEYLNKYGKIFLRDLNIVSTGMNEIPRGGGGLYWSNESPDVRDQRLEAEDDDRAKKIKTSALAELLDHIKEVEWLDKTLSDKQPIVLARELLPSLKGSQYMNIGEFSRPVHAEMAALIDSARRGVAVQGLSMYVTTFPCHNCAKHIIAAGLKQVIYLEPYPKSRAKNLFKEEIELEAPEDLIYDDKVAFIAYTGIAPRQYQRLFGMEDRGKKHGIALKDWEENMNNLQPLYVMSNASASYLLNERQELERLLESIYNWDKKTLCPD